VVASLCRSNRHEYFLGPECGRYGLNVNSARLSTISDNIANSSTYGYKRSQVDFSSMVLEQRSSAYAQAASAWMHKDIAATGSLTSTGNATDFAVAGRGLIPVTNESGLDSVNSERSLMLMPTGSFYTDQNGYLRTQTGHFLLGWPANSSGDIGNVSRQQRP
jgi:flagellar hook protein FlgE